MKSKNIITILLTILLSELSVANFYQKGDTLYVWATSGLNMREGPGTDFAKIKKLEYGEKVQVIDDYLRSTPLSIRVIKKSKKSDAFVMKGHWVRVLIGTQEGYVFDGYLSRLPVLKIEQKNTKNSKNTYQVKEGVLSYIERNFKKIDEKKMGDFENGEEDHNHIISYSNGFEFFSGGNKACGWEGFKIKDISLNEAFLIFSIIYHLEFNAKNNLEFNFKYELDTEGVIFINLFIGDIEDIYFEYHNNSVNIYLEGCC